jgi:hypothetical protein
LDIASISTCAILQLKRGVSGGKLNHVVEVFETLDLSPFCGPECDPKTFKLCGAVCHYGQPLTSGHYVALRRTRDGTWCLCNDEVVNHISLEPLRCIYFLTFRLRASCSRRRRSLVGKNRSIVAICVTRSPVRAEGRASAPALRDAYAKTMPGGNRPRQRHCKQARAGCDRPPVVRLGASSPCNAEWANRDAGDAPRGADAGGGAQGGSEPTRGGGGRPHRLPPHLAALRSAGAARPSGSDPARGSRGRKDAE